VTVPPAWKTLARVEESATDPPTEIAVADKVVAMVGVAFPLTVISTKPELGK